MATDGGRREVRRRGRGGRKEGRWRGFQLVRFYFFVVLKTWQKPKSCPEFSYFVRAVSTVFKPCYITEADQKQERLNLTLASVLLILLWD